jgi:hypothetical protein
LLLAFPTPVAAPIQLALAPIAGAMARIIIPLLARGLTIKIVGGLILFGTVSYTLYEVVTGIIKVLEGWQISLYLYNQSLYLFII